MSGPKILNPSMKVLPAASDSISRAVTALLAGRLVGLPTETVYGLAARGDDERAVEQIFKVKGRPRGNPLILHASCFEDACSLFSDELAPPLRRRLERLRVFWPGPLTLIGPRQRAILNRVTAGGETVAVRVPDHPVALAVLRELTQTAGFPIPVAAPSANVSNYISPTTAAHVAEGLGEQVELILDGGPCRVGLESTILFLGTESSAAQVLRSGEISIENLSDALGEAVLAPPPRRSNSAAEIENLVAAPGQFAKHYSPRTPLTLLHESVEVDRQPTRNPKERVLRIEFGPILSHAPDGPDEVWTFSPDGLLTTAASRLYALLRQADEAGFDRIEIVPCAEAGLGIAIMDRLRRASHE